MFEGLFSNLDLTALQDLIITLFQWISNFDPKAIDSETVAKLLTTFSGVWIPIAEKANELLNKYFGF